MTRFCRETPANGSLRDEEIRILNLRKAQKLCDRTCHGNLANLSLSLGLSYVKLDHDWNVYVLAGLAPQKPLKRQM